MKQAYLLLLYVLAKSPLYDLSSTLPRHEYDHLLFLVFDVWADACMSMY